MSKSLQKLRLNEALDVLAALPDTSLVPTLAQLRRDIDVLHMAVLALERRMVALEAKRRKA